MTIDFSSAFRLLQLGRRSVTILMPYRASVSSILLIGAGLAFLLTSCSKKKTAGDQVPVSPYDFTIVYSRDIDSNLAISFNQRIVDNLIPRVHRFQSSRMFPGALPGVKLLSARFEKSPPENLNIFYDELADRFYSILDRYFVTAFEELVGDRFESGITERQAFEIAALAVYLQYRPRTLVCRKADLFLEPRLREYINQTYAQKSGESTKELSSDWWAWSAFPLANEDYRRMLARYRDQIQESSDIEDIPDGLIEVPTVNRAGMYFEVTMYGLPPGNVREITRYRLRIASDGRLHKHSAEVVLVY